jgi:hypothetical protein
MANNGNEHYTGGSSAYVDKALKTLNLLKRSCRDSQVSSSAYNKVEGEPIIFKNHPFDCSELKEQFTGDLERIRQYGGNVDMPKGQYDKWERDQCKGRNCPSYIVQLESDSCAV